MKGSHGMSGASRIQERMSTWRTNILFLQQNEQTNTGNARVEVQEIYRTGLTTATHTHRDSSMNVGIDIIEHTSQHMHVIQTQVQNTSINHNHDISTNIGNTSINHRHVIQTQQTGGGEPFDNRPEYYSLWYIMKL